MADTFDCTIVALTDALNAVKQFTPDERRRLERLALGANRVLIGTESNLLNVLGAIEALSERKMDVTKLKQEEVAKRQHYRTAREDHLRRNKNCRTFEENYEAAQMAVVDLCRDKVLPALARAVEQNDAAKNDKYEQKLVLTEKHFESQPVQSNTHQRELKELKTRFRIEALKSKRRKESHRQLLENNKWLQAKLNEEMKKGADNEKRFSSMRVADMKQKEYIKHLEQQITNLSVKSTQLGDSFKNEQSQMQLKHNGALGVLTERLSAKESELTTITHQSYHIIAIKDAAISRYEDQIVSLETELQQLRQQNEKNLAEIANGNKCVKSLRIKIQELRKLNKTKHTRISFEVQRLKAKNKELTHEVTNFRDLCNCHSLTHKRAKLNSDQPSCKEEPMDADDNETQLALVVSNVTSHNTRPVAATIAEPHSDRVECSEALDAAKSWFTAKVTGYSPKRMKQYAESVREVAFAVTPDMNVSIEQRAQEWFWISNIWDENHCFAPTFDRQRNDIRCCKNTLGCVVDNHPFFNEQVRKYSSMRDDI